MQHDSHPATQPSFINTQSMLLIITCQEALAEELLIDTEKWEYKCHGLASLFNHPCAVAISQGVFVKMGAGFILTVLTIMMADGLFQTILDWSQNAQANIGGVAK